MYIYIYIYIERYTYHRLHNDAPAPASVSDDAGAAFNVTLATWMSALSVHSVSSLSELTRSFSEASLSGKPVLSVSDIADDVPSSSDTIMSQGDASDSSPFAIWREISSSTARGSPFNCREASVYSLVLTMAFSFLIWAFRRRNSSSVFFVQPIEVRADDVAQHHKVRLRRLVQLKCFTKLALASWLVSLCSSIGAFRPTCMSRQRPVNRQHGSDRSRHARGRRVV